MQIPWGQGFFSILFRKYIKSIWKSHNAWDTVSTQEIMLNEWCLSKMGFQTLRNKAAGYGVPLKRFEWGHDTTIFVSTMISPTETGREDCNSKPCTQKRPRKRQARSKESKRAVHWRNVLPCKTGQRNLILDAYFICTKPFGCLRALSLLYPKLYYCIATWSMLSFPVVRGGVGMFFLAIIVPNQGQ